MFAVYYCTSLNYLSKKAIYAALHLGYTNQLRVKYTQRALFKSVSYWYAYQKWCICIKIRSEFWNLTTDSLTFDYIYSLPIFRVFITLNQSLKHTSMLWRYNDLQWSCRRQLGNGKVSVTQTVISSSKTFFYRFQVWKQIWRLTIFTSANVNIMLLSIIITIYSSYNLW